MAIADGRDGVVVGDPAEEVDGHDGADPAALRALLGDGAVEEVGVEVAVGAGVDEARLRAGVGDRVGRGHERHGGDHDEVAGLHAHPEHGQVQRGGARGERDRVGGAGAGGDLALEGGHLGPGRSDPARAQRPQDVLLLEGAHVGR